MQITPDDYLPYAKEFEGSIPYMYLDTAGVVTIGIGHALETPAEATAIPFTLRASGQLASAAQIDADYVGVKAQPSGQIASYYKPFSQTGLGDDGIADLFRQDLGEFLPTLAARVPGYAEFPATAQLALLDLAFNLGVNGLLTKFPKMMAFVTQRNWAGSAGQCRRPQLGDQRNQQVAAWFQSAAQP